MSDTIPGDLLTSTDIGSVWIGAEAWVVYKVYWVILLCLHDRKLLTYKTPMILTAIL